MSVKTTQLLEWQENLNQCLWSFHYTWLLESPLFTLVHFFLPWSVFLKHTEMETNRSGVALLLFLATVSPGFTRAHVATPKGNAIFTLCFLELRGPNSSFLSCFEVHAPLALPTGSYFLPQDLLLVYRAQVMGRFWFQRVDHTPHLDLCSSSFSRFSGMTQSSGTFRGVVFIHPVVQLFQPQACCTDITQMYTKWNTVIPWQALEDLVAA